MSVSVDTRLDPTRPNIVQIVIVKEFAEFGFRHSDNL